MSPRDIGAHPPSADRAGGATPPSPSVSAEGAHPLRVGNAALYVGDCLDILATLEPESVDSCVCDPPYHLTSIVKRFAKSNLEQPADKDLSRVNAGQYKRLARGFMGQQWDGGDVAFRPETWAAVYRVLKPGAHLIAFSGTRTYHRMVCAIEDAGFEVRDQLAWVYGSGFPKSHNQPGGWGTALKPAWEPICLARKPLQGTVAANVLEHGTGAINIDECRIETADDLNGGAYAVETAKCERSGSMAGGLLKSGIGDFRQPVGRWPANIIHDGSEEVLAHFPETGLSSGGRGAASGRIDNEAIYGRFSGNNPGQSAGGFGDSGSAARFFYCAKTSAAERHIGCEDIEKGNAHPTVKPVDLMRWLTRLVTPKGGVVLDPFAGSGSTLIAASWEGFRSIGCELSAEYADIAVRRLTAAQKKIEDSQRQLSMFIGDEAA